MFNRLSSGLKLAYLTTQLALLCRLPPPAGIRNVPAHSDVDMPNFCSERKEFSCFHVLSGTPGMVLRKELAVVHRSEDLKRAW